MEILGTHAAPDERSDLGEDNVRRTGNVENPGKREHAFGSEHANLENLAPRRELELGRDASGHDENLAARQLLAGHQATVGKLEVAPTFEKLIRHRRRHQRKKQIISRAHTPLLVFRLTD